LPEKLKKQIEILLNSTGNFGAVYCKMIFYNCQTGQRTNIDLKEIDFHRLYTVGSQLITPSNGTLLIKKNILDEVGYFDEKLHVGEDAELAIRISKNYAFAFADDFLVLVTRNHHQLTGSIEKYIHSREYIYEKHKDYLSSTILFNICREISAFYILFDDLEKAKKYLREALRYKRDFKTFILSSGIVSVPYLIKYLYNKKYGGKLPLYVDINIS
jgi:hypothetical protein